MGFWVWGEERACDSTSVSSRIVLLFSHGHLEFCTRFPLKSLTLLKMKAWKPLPWMVSKTLGLPWTLGDHMDHPGGWKSPSWKKSPLAQSNLMWKGWNHTFVWNPEFWLGQLISPRLVWERCKANLPQSSLVGEEWNRQPSLGNSAGVKTQFVQLPG